MHCSRHDKSKCGLGMNQGMPKQGVAREWQADCLSPGKAKHCSRHSKTKGRQGMTHGMPKQWLAKSWQTDCLSPGKALRCSGHAKTRGGQGMASRMLVIGHGNALLTACQNKGWPGNGKPITCHRARQFHAHGMPRPRVAKEWQVDSLSPGKAMHWPRHDSRHAKTRGGKGMASGLLVIGKGNALLMACQNKGWPRHGKLIACHRARQCIAHGMPRPRVAEA
ncbi:hypothetical protein RHGRI_010953 [Rhododendron griersonianum]|uniref:Uncharacterized protein n=1 Tax=Rhododendron griersonianum TaxID=479676 RepID=A0AAV6KKC6_9ERIC|nr:hypothetical protein RHGRI_010953 [Rhododendron griersonianum]